MFFIPQHAVERLFGHAREIAKCIHQKRDRALCIRQYYELQNMCEIIFWYFI